MIVDLRVLAISVSIATIISVFWSIFFGSKTLPQFIMSLQPLILNKLQMSSRGQKFFLIFSFNLLVLVLVLLLILHPVSPQPDGLWLNSVNGQSTLDIVSLSVRAYPAHLGDPLIDHVEFTVSWPGSYSWKIFCIDYSPTFEDVYTCDASLNRLNAPPGPIELGFSVYDQAGDVATNPAGVQSIDHMPSSS